MCERGSRNTRLLDLERFSESSSNELAQRIFDATISGEIGEGKQRNLNTLIETVASGRYEAGSRANDVLYLGGQFLMQAFGMPRIAWLRTTEEGQWLPDPVDNEVFRDFLDKTFGLKLKTKKGASRTKENDLVANIGRKICAIANRLGKHLDRDDIAQYDDSTVIDIGWEWEMENCHLPAMEALGLVKRINLN